MAPAPDEHGEILLVAHVIPAARPPTPDRLRAALWSRLPGYAWPLFAAGIDMRGGSGQRVLSALWAVDPATRAGPTGGEPLVGVLLLQALDRARGAVVIVPSHAVTANRTLETLAAALAAGARPSPA